MQETETHEQERHEPYRISCSAVGEVELKGAKARLCGLVSDSTDSRCDGDRGRTANLTEPCAGRMAPTASSLRCIACGLYFQSTRAPAACNSACSFRARPGGAVRRAWQCRLRDRPVIHAGDLLFPSCIFQEIRVGAQPIGEIRRRVPVWFRGCVFAVFCKARRMGLTARTAHPPHRELATNCDHRAIFCYLLFDNFHNWSQSQGLLAFLRQLLAPAAIASTGVLGRWCRISACEYPRDSECPWSGCAARLNSTSAGLEEFEPYPKLGFPS